MQTPSNKPAWHATGRVSAIAAVAVAIAIYAALVIRPPLIYSAYGVFIDYPALSTGTLAETLGHPGWAASYLAAILAQLYYYPWVGGVVVAALALLLGVGFERLAALCREGRHTPWPILLAPPLAVVAIHNRYVMVLDVLVGLALGVWAAVLMCRVAGRRPWVAAIASAVLAGLLWQAAGGAAMAFALTVGLYIALVQALLDGRACSGGCRTGGSLGGGSRVVCADSRGGILEAHAACRGGIRHGCRRAGGGRGPFCMGASVGRRVDGCGSMGSQGRCQATQEARRQGRQT